MSEVPLQFYLSLFSPTIFLRLGSSLLASCRGVYRGTSLIRNSPSLGPYSRLMPRALLWS